MSFWGELRRRNVFKAAAAYVVGSWLIVQVISVLSDLVTLPETLGTVALVFLGIGFPFALLVAWAFEVTPGGLKRTADVERSQSIVHITGQRLNYIVTILLALAVAAFATDAYLFSGDPTSTDATANQSPLGLAVLPFTAFSQDDELAYIAAGLSTDIRRRLTRNDDLYVPAAASSELVGGSSEGVEQMGETLNVAYLLDGDIRTSGTDLRIGAELIAAATGEIVDTWLFNEPLNAVLDNQDGVVEAVTSQVEDALGIRESGMLPGGTDDAAALEHYYRAEYLRQIQPDVGLAWLEWRAEYRAALDLDPNFALAWIGLAELLFNRPGYEEQQNQAVDRALAIAPELPGSHRILGQRYTEQHQWREAEIAYREMLDRSPRGDSEANLVYGSFLRQVGRAREALRYLQRARASDPAVSQPLAQLSVTYDALGNYSRAKELYATAQETTGFDFMSEEPQFLRVLAEEGPRAAWAVQDFDPTSPPAIDATLPATNQAFLRMLNTAKQNLEDPDQGLAALRIAFDDPLLQYTGAMGNIALYASYFGDTELSLATLRRSLLNNPILLPLSKSEWVM